MIKVEIKKSGTLYTWEYEDFSGLDDLAKVYEEALLIATGKGNHETDTAILDLGYAEAYEHIRVWEEVPEVPYGGPPAFKVPDGMPRWDELNTVVTYLGRTCELDIQQFVDAKGRAYYLPVFLDEKPALDMANSSHLLRMLSDALTALGLINGDYKAIIPHASIPDWEEARAYIKDYIDATKPVTSATESHTATAWKGHYLADKEGTE